MKKLILILLGVDLLFLYLFFVKGYFFGAGWFFGGVFLIFLAYLWQEILNKIIIFGKSFWIKFVLAFLPVILLLGFFSSAFIVFYKLDGAMIWWTYFLSAIFTVIFLLVAQKSKKLSKTLCKIECGFFKKRWYLIVLYLVGWIFGLFLLYQSKTWIVGLVSFFQPKFGEALQTPWQAISPLFLVLFFLLTFLVGIITFSKIKVGKVLFVLILHSFLLHSYLPLAHANPWGGDVWRHLAIEQKIVNEEQILPVLIGKNVEWKETFGVDIPAVFTAPQKYSYGQMWGLNVVFAKTFGFELKTLHIWLVPILWSFFVPLLLFFLGLGLLSNTISTKTSKFLLRLQEKIFPKLRLGKYFFFSSRSKLKSFSNESVFDNSPIFKSRKLALLLVWLSFLPFPFQALGALTLPVSLGFISFLFTLLLLVLYFNNDKRIKKDNKKLQKMLAIFFGVSMFFSYSLYFLILLPLVFAILIWRSLINISPTQTSKFWLRLQEKIFPKLRLGKYFFFSSRSKFEDFSTAKYLSEISKKYKNNFIKVVLFIMGVLFLPIVEIISKTSVWPKNFNFVESLTQFVGQFSGWYFARAIRPHDILSGNIFFNHTPELAFVGSIFTNWRWYIPVVLLILWGITVFGFIKKFKTKIVNEFIILFLSISIFGSYIIGWFFLEGDRQLIRRLDLLLAFSVLLLFVFGASYLLQNKKVKPYMVLIFLAAFSFFATTNLASGPDMRVVSENEYKMAEEIWDKIDGENYCVIADTWVLLPLEAISSRKIIGGGFPIDYQFGQSELSEIYNGLKNGENEELLKRAFELTNSNTCFIVREYKIGGSNLEVKKLEKNVN